MSTKKKIKRSLSQRSLGFTKFMSPFKSTSGTIPEHAVISSGMLSAVSDPQLNIQDFNKQVIDKNGRIITSSPDINGNNVVYNFKILEQKCVPDTFLASRLSYSNGAFIDTARYGKLTAGSAQRSITAARLAGLRPTVSYQNLSPNGEAFSKERVGLISAGGTSVGKCTTNVAWLVGAKSLEHSSSEHHIDIVNELDHQPPTNLEVAPLFDNTKGKSENSYDVYDDDAAKHKEEVLKTTVELYKVSESKCEDSSSTTKSHQSVQSGHNSWKVEPNNIKLAATMGYSLARSKTISDIPQWATHNQQKKQKNVKLGYKNYEYLNKVSSSGLNTLSSNSTQTSDSIIDLASSSINSSSCSLQAVPNSLQAGPNSLQAGHISTNGSLKSRIVKQRTLLRSQTRLYKFSQSLSSLNTLGTEESRASSCDRSSSITR